MHTKLVKTGNVQRLHVALAELRKGKKNVPGLGLLHGWTGAGKTTAISHAIGHFNAVYIRANAATGFSSLLSELAWELELESKHQNSKKLDGIMTSLGGYPRPIFIDEADYLLRDKRMVEVLRDIHDKTGAPVMLIGMDGFQRKLTDRYPQVARRVSQLIEFKPLDLADTTKVVNELCEVNLSREMVERVYKTTKGSIGHIVIALTNIESVARDNNWREVTPELWGSRAMFLGDKVEVAPEVVDVP